MKGLNFNLGNYIQVGTNNNFKKGVVAHFLGVVYAQ
jgi:hypothetical protein